MIPTAYFYIVMGEHCYWLEVQGTPKELARKFEYYARNGWLSSACTPWNI